MSALGLIGFVLGYAVWLSFVSKFPDTDLNLLIAVLIGMAGSMVAVKTPRWIVFLLDCGSEWREARRRKR